MAGRPVNSADPLWSRAWPAPAKLNLFLHVVGRRSDGYHLLQTVFRFVDFGDELRFAPRDDERVVATAPLPGVPPELDLTVRAATALRDAAGIRRGVDITLQKRLPLGGGLGGGSSDAATTLLVLNRLWRLDFDNAHLQRIGLSLGADVPIFVHGRAAFAEGVGERFTDLDLPPAWYLVLVPALSVPTADIFRAADLRRDTPSIEPSGWRPGSGGNDLEPIACRLFPDIRRHLEWLGRWGDARMTGSGACVFAAFAEETAARSALAALPEDMKGFVARGLDRHPLAA
jgi:4-diphosphocytidyl-2-C-methyl-D-erythritol kinase